MLSHLLRLTLALLVTSFCHAQIKPMTETYLGDGKRNYYGNYAPTKLRIKWKKHLGTGFTMVGQVRKKWSGAGWTGQALVVEENGEIYLIQPTLSHYLRKIRARDGKEIWKSNLGDVIKGTPSFVTTNSRNPEHKYLIISGSRRGYGAHFFNDPAYSLHAVSYLTGKKVWQHNSARTQSNSRDVDASGVMIGSKFCIPTENGKLLYLSPNLSHAVTPEGAKFPEPKIYKEYPLFDASVLPLYKHELSCESSPTVIGGTAYTAAGCGKVYGHSAGLFGNKWIYNVGGDLNGTMPFTNDKHLLLGIEKEFISGNGGVMKLKPKGRGASAVKWYFPLPNKRFYEWSGGMVGSPAVNHRYKSAITKDLACFVGVDGTLTLINHKKLAPNKKVYGPKKQQLYNTPLVLDTAKLPHGSISSPLFLGDKIVIGYDNGLDLYQVTPDLKLKLLDRLKGPMFDATPTVWNGRIYAASKNGYLYCLGN